MTQRTNNRLDEIRNKRKVLMKDETTNSEI